VPDFFLVEQAKGPEFDHGRPRREQRLWDEHAAFMDELVEQGVIHLGGPIGEGDGETTLLIFDVSTEADVRALLERDPWFETVLTLVSIRPWTVWLRHP
jgi:uncharacterized protein YciI